MKTRSTYTRSKSAEGNICSRPTASTPCQVTLSRSNSGLEVIQSSVRAMVDPVSRTKTSRATKGRASTVVSCRRMMWTLSKGACVDTPRQVRDNTDELSASNVELDHQHHLSNVFLLWCAWQLYQLGDGGCHQRGCRALCCHSDSVCPGESMQYCIFYCGRVMH